jgi:hypothetical protein
MRRLLCFFRGWHLPQRTPIGGFRCEVCGAAGATWEELA